MIEINFERISFWKNDILVTIQVVISEKIIHLSCFRWAKYRIEVRCATGSLFLVRSIKFSKLIISTSVSASSTESFSKIRSSFDQWYKSRCGSSFKSRCIFLGFKPRSWNNNCSRGYSYHQKHVTCFRSRENQEILWRVSIFDTEYWILNIEYWILTYWTLIWRKSIIWSQDMSN